MKKEKKIAQILIELAKGKNENEKLELAKFLISILKKEGKIFLFPKILKEIKKRSEREKVKIFFAKELPAETKEKIKEKVKEIVGKEKEIKFEIDENILGGFLVKSENILIDATVEGLLKKLLRKIKI